MFKRKKNKTKGMSVIICSSSGYTTDTISSYIKNHPINDTSFTDTYITNYGYEAIRHAKGNNRDDLLIIDRMLDGAKDFKETILRIKESNPNIKVLLICPVVDSEVDEAMRAGLIDNYMLQPYQKSHLLNKVYTIFQELDIEL